MKTLSALLLAVMLLTFGRAVSAGEEDAAATDAVKEGAAARPATARNAATERTAAGGLATGDPVRGKRAFFTCYACHYVSKDLLHHTGPNLYGMFDRRAGTALGYAYSQVMRRSKIIWTPEELDHWLRDPKGYLPGSKMVFIGVPNAQERADLIAYLQSLMND